MQLSHMSDRPIDLKTQMQDLTRNTTDILLLEIPMIDNSNELLPHRVPHSIHSVGMEP